ncbi:hypothetical protein C8R45DRAFT_990496 [Mycena sanguinolenta]|nr:hypothetical protein C8R45DRAFT_990496 [Mycena sanguinolenta]
MKHVLGLKPCRLAGPSRQVIADSPLSCARGSSSSSQRSRAQNRFHACFYVVHFEWGGLLRSRATVNDASRHCAHSFRLWRITRNSAASIDTDGILDALAPTKLPLVLVDYLSLPYRRRPIQCEYIYPLFWLFVSPCKGASFVGRAPFTHSPMLNARLQVKNSDSPSSPTVSVMEPRPARRYLVNRHEPCVFKTRSFAAPTRL